MFNRLATLVLRHRLAVVIAMALFTLGSLALAPRVGFNFTPQQLFEGRGDDDQYREIFAERFGREDNVIIVLVEAPDVLATPVVSLIRDLTYELRRLDTIEDAQSLATIAIPRPESLSSEPYLGDLSQQLASAPPPFRGPPISPEQARELGEYALGEPLIAGRLLSADQKSAIVAARIDTAIQDVNELRAINHRVAETLALYDLPEGVRATLAGVPPLRVEIVDNLRREQLLFVPLTALVYLLVLIFLFRTPSGVLLPLGTVVIALLSTLAMLVLTNYPINIINNVLPTLIFVIGISDSIHMLTRQAEEVEAGRPHSEAIRQMIRHTGVACLLTTGTTAVGFLSLYSAETTILRNFGWQAATGVMLAYLATMLFLPAGLTFLKPARCIHGHDTPVPTQAPQRQMPALERLLVRSGDALLSRPWTVLTVSLVACGLLIAQASHVIIDTKILEVFSQNHPTFQSTVKLEEDLSGILPIEISLESPVRDRFKDPQVLDHISRLQASLRDHPIVLSTESHVDYLRAARAAITGDPTQRDAAPASLAEVEQLLLLISDAPDTRTGVHGFVTGDFRNARILLRVSDAGAKANLKLAQELHTELERRFPSDSNISYRLTGDAYVASAALDSFIRDLLVSILLAMGIIFGLLTVVFRSLKIGLISLIPNALPLLMTLGYMGWAGININTTTIIIFAISLGIAVDDSIHFFARFIEELPQSASLKEAILNTYFGAGRAILLTSVLLLIGLSVLTLSDFVPTQQFGILTGMTIAGALVADLVILPVLLYLVLGRFPLKVRRPSTPGERSLTGPSA
ncbi:hypothetical protein DL240_04970 [Lujinxingia litoralis]|uniref:SSD domain-containing protein n=1 Tax=Lujinxingia litoralis TaxID=2211119 RepID=A0A328C6F3_9DELT|nr:efflux RND transporter permease subunit [Lujinxingia litoralis]RAL23515.1 hypothetical protein DL240_04970 [Lujinxingia litoralis]